MVPLAAWPSPDGNASKSSGRTCASPPGEGRAKIENSSRPHPRKFGQKRFLAVRRSWREKWGGLFWATSLEKIFGGMIAIISFRPGGWMQQSAAPSVLSFRSEAREGAGSARLGSGLPGCRNGRRIRSKMRQGSMHESRKLRLMARARF